MSNNSTISFIENHEEEEAKEVVRKRLGFEPPRAAGFQIVVEIYVRPEEMVEIVDDDGNKKSIILPSSVRGDDKFINCTGLVLSTGPSAYVGDRFKYSGPWCKVGDWVVIPRHAGTQANYRGIPVMWLADDKILAVIPDPTYVTRD